MIQRMIVGTEYAYTSCALVKSLQRFPFAFEKGEENPYTRIRSSECVQLVHAETQRESRQLHIEGVSIECELAKHIADRRFGPRELRKHFEAF
jgi:hypothetical protein